MHEQEAVQKLYGGPPSSGDAAEYEKVFGPPALTEAVRATRRYAQDFFEAPPKRHLDAFQAGYEGHTYDGQDQEAYQTGRQAAVRAGGPTDA